MQSILSLKALKRKKNHITLEIAQITLEIVLYHYKFHDWEIFCAVEAIQADHVWVQTWFYYALDNRHCCYFMFCVW